MKHSVKEVTLKNGAKGLLIHVPSAEVMYVDLNFRGGDFLCPEEKWETAHLMEHLVLGANKKYRTQQKFTRELEQNGAYSNASTSTYNIDYYTECADFEWDRVLDLMLLSIGSPLFLKKEYEAEYSNVIEELTQRANNHASILTMEMRKRSGMIGYTYQAGIDSMPNISLEDVKAHHASIHYGKNMRFVISGNVHSRSKEIIKKLESIEIPAGDEDRIGLPDEHALGGNSAFYMPNETVPNLYFSFDTFAEGKMTAPEFDAASVGDYILSDGFSSKIFGKARERGLVYDLGSSPYYTKSSSAWSMDGQVSRDNAPELFKIIARELRNIVENGIDLDDLAHIKKRLIGSYYRGAQTVSGIAHGYSGKYFSDGTIADYDAYPERVRSVTRKRVQDVYKKLFADENWILGFYGTMTDEEQTELRAIIASIWR